LYVKFTEIGTLELNSNIHSIVDQIQNQQLLLTLYKILKSNNGKKSNGVWDSLTAEERVEVMLAFEELEDEDNLIESDKVLNKFK